MKNDIDVYKDQTFLFSLFFLKDKIKLDWQMLRDVSASFLLMERKPQLN